MIPCLNYLGPIRPAPRPRISRWSVSCQTRTGEARCAPTARFQTQNFSQKSFPCLSTGLRSFRPVCPVQPARGSIETHGGSTYPAPNPRPTRFPGSPRFWFNLVIWEAQPAPSSARRTSPAPRRPRRAPDLPRPVMSTQPHTQPAIRHAARSARTAALLLIELTSMSATPASAPELIRVLVCRCVLSPTPTPRVRWSMSSRATCLSRSGLRSPSPVPGAPNQIASSSRSNLGSYLLRTFLESRA